MRVVENDRVITALHKVEVRKWERSSNAAMSSNSLREDGIFRCLRAGNVRYCNPSIRPTQVSKIPSKFKKNDRRMTTVILKSRREEQCRILLKDARVINASPIT